MEINEAPVLTPHRWVKYAVWFKARAVYLSVESRGMVLIVQSLLHVSAD